MRSFFKCSVNASVFFDLGIGVYKRFEKAHPFRFGVLPPAMAPQIPAKGIGVGCSPKFLACRHFYLNNY